jgi:hypothetical protein
MAAETRDGKNPLHLIYDKGDVTNLAPIAPEKQTKRTEYAKTDRTRSEKVEISRPGQCTKRGILSEIEQELGNGYVHGGKARVWDNWKLQGWVTGREATTGRPSRKIGILYGGSRRGRREGEGMGRARRGI